MRNRIALALTLSLFAILAGCGKSSKLVGTWTTSKDGLNAEATYGADGNATMVLTGNQFQGMKVSITASYKDEGDKISMTTKDVSLDNVPAALKAQEATLKDTIKNKMEIGKEKVDTIKWLSDTSFTTTDEKGSSVTFTKKA
jgi:hypothetical protein